MSLLTTLQVKEIALAWGDPLVKRVYVNDSLTVTSVDDKEVFKFSVGAYGQAVQGVWLEFEVNSTTFELKSPSGVAGNGIVAALNALNESSPVNPVVFYPIHDVDAAVTIQVIRPRASVDLLNTRRTMFRREASFKLLAITRLAEIPAWLETARQY